MLSISRKLYFVWWGQKGRTCGWKETHCEHCGNKVELHSLRFDDICIIWSQVALQLESMLYISLTEVKKENRLRIKFFSSKSVEKFLSNRRQNLSQKRTSSLLFTQVWDIIPSATAPIQSEVVLILSATASVFCKQTPLLQAVNWISLHSVLQSWKVVFP